MSGGPLRHAVVIDTVRDVVLGDVGGKMVQTAGVAVRPFWWSAACVEVLVGQQ